MVRGDADDLHVRLDAKQSAHAFADDQVVVREKDGDAPVVHAPNLASKHGQGQGCRPPNRPWCQPYLDTTGRILAHWDRRI